MEHLTMAVKSSIVKTVCSMCLKEVNETVKCAWDYSESCLAGRLQKAATLLKNGTKVLD